MNFEFQIRPQVANGMSSVRTKATESQPQVDFGMRAFLPPLIPAASLVALSAVVVFGFWFHPRKLVLFWDQTYPLNPVLNLRTLFSVWHSAQGFGGVDATSVAMIPYFVIVWLLELILRSTELAQMSLYFLVLVSGLMGFYALSQSIIFRTGNFDRKSFHAIASCSIAALFYTFNPYAVFYEWRIVSTTIFLQAVLPWYLLLIVLGSRSRTRGFNLRYLVALFLVTIGMSPGLSNPAMVPIVAVLTVGCILCGSKRPNFRFIIGAAITSFLGMSFWLFPLLASTSYVASQGSYGGTLSALIGNSHNLSLWNTLRFVGMLPITEIYHGEPDFPWSHIYAGGGWWILFTLLPLSAWALIIYAIIRRRLLQRFIAPIVLSALALTFLILSSGANGPLGSVFVFVFQHLKWFQAYRDPDAMFGFGYVVSFSLLLVCAINLVVATSTRNMTRVDDRPLIPNRSVSVKMVVILSAVSLSLGAFAWPMFTGSVFRAAGPIRPSALVTMPNSLASVTRILTMDDKSNMSILSFPQQVTPLESERWSSGYVGFDPLISLTNRPIISTLSSDALEQEAVNQLYLEFQSEPLRAVYAARDMGVGWLLFRWDNNYKFGGLGSEQKMHFIERRIVAAHLGSVLVRSKEMTLVKMKVASGKFATSAKLLGTTSVSSPVGLNEIGSARTPNSVPPYASLPQLANLRGARVDVGSQILKINSRTMSLWLKLLGPSEGSARIPIKLPKTARYLIVSVTMSSNAGFVLTASRYANGKFSQGGPPRLVNPSREANGFSISKTRYAYVYDLSSLSFIPNQIDVHLDSRGTNLAKMKIDSLFAVTRLPSFERSPPGQLSVVGVGQTIQTFSVPTNSLTNTKYQFLSFRIKTGADTQLYVSTERLIGGRYIYGTELQPVTPLGSSRVSVTPDGAISSTKLGRVFFLLSGQPGLNTVAFVVNHLSGGSAILQVNDPQLTNYAPSTTSFVRNLTSKVSLVIPPDVHLGIKGALILNSGDLTSVAAGSLKGQSVGIVYPETYNSGFILQERLPGAAGSTWRDVGGVHVVADGFLNGWLLSDKMVTNYLSESPSYKGQIYFRVEFEGNGFLDIGIAITFIALFLGIFGMLLQRLIRGSRSDIP